jgi:hypothetical protein
MTEQRNVGARRSHTGRFGLFGVVVLAGLGLVAACTPPAGPPADPAPPVINAFTSTARRAVAPVTATLAWNIADVNNDVLTCRVDVDDDGTVDREIVPCDSSDTVLAEYDGDGTARLEVTDGTSEPVSATVGTTVADGPPEDYEITLRLDPSMRPEFRAAFEAAAARWESVITAGVTDQPLELPDGLFGWIPGFSGVVDDVLIDARDIDIDGAGKVLGRAGGFLVREPDWQPYYGLMEFDTADLDSLADQGRLGDVILHEMGHVLGLGTNWLLVGYVTDLLTDPAYTGPGGVAAHQELGGERFVPLENEGGLGTVIGHWREDVFDDELMTGYLGSRPAQLSRLTIAALADLGYGVDLSQADPYELPSGAAARAHADEHEHEIGHTQPIRPFLDGLPTQLPPMAPAG